MKNKQIRRFCCVLLALCLLCSCFAVPAFATEAALFAVMSVTASLAMDGLIRGFGVLPVDSESGAFGTLVNNCVSYVESVSDFIIDGLCRVSGVRTGTGFASYLPVGVAQLVWEWLSNSGAVSEISPVYDLTPNFGESVQEKYLTKLQKAQSYPYYFQGYNSSGRFFLGWASVPFEAVQLDDGRYRIALSDHDGGFYYWNSSATVPSETTADYLNLTSYRFFSGSNPTYEVSDGLALGSYESAFDSNNMPILLENAPVYAPWTEHIYSIPSYSNQDEFVSGLPVSIPDSSTSALTQSQAQAGTNSLDWSQADTETDGVALSNILSAITSLPVKLVSTVTQGIANFFGITGTADSYAISLKDFFPFCIPFDLYEFFTVLAAPPEPPVIEWEIPAPMFGGPFQLEVDLSAWDDIAALFRTFELLAFIVGLALITREKFLRS